MLERHHCADLHRYCATDVTAAFGPALLQAVGNPKLSFQARMLHPFPLQLLMSVGTR